MGCVVTVSVTAGVTCARVCLVAPLPPPPGLRRSPDWNKVWAGMGQIPDKFRDFEKWSAGMDPVLRNKLTKVTHWHMVLLGGCVGACVGACLGGSPTLAEV